MAFRREGRKRDKNIEKFLNNFKEKLKSGQVAEHVAACDPEVSSLDSDSELDPSTEMGESAVAADIDTTAINSISSPSASFELKEEKINNNDEINNNYEINNNDETNNDNEIG